MVGLYPRQQIGKVLIATLLVPRRLVQVRHRREMSGGHPCREAARGAGGGGGRDGRRTAERLYEGVGLVKEVVGGGRWRLVSRAWGVGVDHDAVSIVTHGACGISTNPL